jgi:hypothetical protein
LLGQQCGDDKVEGEWPRAYDSAPCGYAKEAGIEWIVPHKANRARKPTQDGQTLKHYRRHWKVERTNAGLGNFCLEVRYERSLYIYAAFFHIACFMIVLRRL